METALPGSLIKNSSDTVAAPRSQHVTMVKGFRLTIVRKMIWLNIMSIALVMYRNPFLALRKVKELKALRDKYRNDHPLPKFISSGRKYFVNFNTPGWPSLSFNRYVRHQLKRFDSGHPPSISTLVFAITKKCGFQCEHCCEWLNLNKPETLSREKLLEIVQRFHALGVSQIQLSGGEPLNRLKDIIYILQNAPTGIDFWLYTTGYSLSAEKATLLKSAGLTGITISLDHYEEDRHNAFRGVKDAYERAIEAVQSGREAGLTVCFSICATRGFVTHQNLERYAELAKNSGVAFIQLLEPKAVGHYAGQDVGLRPEHQKLLEEFFETYNYDPAYTSYPTITYHGYGSRRFGCSGSGTDYVYVDTDGDIHNCPFCQRKLFSAFDASLTDYILQMKLSGCKAYFPVSKLEKS